MAHFAIQVGNVSIEIEDEDMDAKELRRVGEKSFYRVIDLVNEKADDDGE